MALLFESAIDALPLQIHSDWVLPYTSNNPSAFSFSKSEQNEFYSPTKTIKVSTEDLYNLEINL